jgi:prepilin-type N-terminal cleavage/methylation domain-containing protein
MRRRPATARDRGTTLTELLVVVVILGLLAAATRPLFRRDRVGSQARAFAGQMTREFQRARQEAIGTRLPQRAYVFADRVEVRSATAATPPVAATITSPIQRLVQTSTGVSVWDVTTSLTPPASASLTTATYKIIEWNTLGQASIVGTVTPAIALYVRNAEQGVSSVNQRCRVDVSPLTGAATMVETW